MARIGHIALASKDPVATAEFYKKAFGFKEVERVPDTPLGAAVYLTDGAINIAIIKFSHDSSARASTTPGFIISAWWWTAWRSQPRRSSRSGPNAS